MIFNKEKTIEEYKNTPVFMGPKPGLFDTVHKKHPVIWSLYKEMKSLDWSEDEFDYTQCNIDFKSCPKETSEIMVKTLAWQWEADSVASRSTVAILAPFITSSEVWAAVQRISDNEVVHAATYSEIVRMSFDSPNDVLRDILSVKESLTRLKVVEETLETAHRISCEYAMGLRDDSQDTYNNGPFKTMVTLLFLERLQFMASFAVTFTICSTGLFQPIGKAVQKICQDELEVHVEFDKAVLTSELKTERGKTAHSQLKDWMKKLARDCIESELKWVDYLYSENRSMVGLTPELLKQWVLFNAKDPVKFLGIDLPEYTFPRFNPLPNLEKWININKTQGAPQEQDIAQYKVGTVYSDDDNADFVIDF